MSQRNKKKIQGCDVDLLKGGIQQQSEHSAQFTQGKHKKEIRKKLKGTKEEATR
jgi:hypothetical protein